MAIVEGVLATSAAIGAGLKLYDYISNADQRRIAKEVFEEQAVFQKDLLRRARGKWTESELREIERMNQPALTALSGNLSARLGPSSGITADLLNQAQQRTIFNAQQQAGQLALGVGGGGAGGAQTTPLFQSLGQIAATLQELKRSPGSSGSGQSQFGLGEDEAEPLPELEGTVQSAIDLIASQQAAQGYTDEQKRAAARAMLSAPGF